MNYQAETPFDNIESAHEYVNHLLERHAKRKIKLRGKSFSGEPPTGSAKAGFATRELQNWTSFRRTSPKAAAS